MPNVSRQCLRKMQEQLVCYASYNSDNTSKLICDPKDDDDGSKTARAHATFMTVAVVTATLAIALNLMVLLTIGFSKKLYTLVNYLVSLLCVNQFIWAAIAITEAFDLAIVSPTFCTIRVVGFSSTLSLNFMLVVTITLLRYLLMVRNHSYPANWQNVFLFTCIPLLACALQIVWLSSSATEQCGTLLSWTSAGYMISKLSKRKHAPTTLFVMAIQYATGFAVLFFCYVSILAKVIRSRRLVASHSQNGQTTEGHSCIARMAQWISSRFRVQSTSHQSNANQQAGSSQVAVQPSNPLPQDNHPVIIPNEENDQVATIQLASGQPPEIQESVCVCVCVCI